MDTFLLADLNAWWSGLMTLERLFVGIAIVSGIFAAILTISGLLGLDHEVDGLDGLHSDVEGFSLRAITGFFLGFGWVGFACTNADMSATVSVVAAMVAGLVMLFGIRGIMKLMRRLQSDGTMHYENAIGKEGVAYVMIPASGEMGGQVTVIFDQRSETLPAIQRGSREISSGSRVRVTGVEGRILHVEAIS